MRSTGPLRQQSRKHIMKKNNRKLILTAETVRSLSIGELTAARGGEEARSVIGACWWKSINSDCVNSGCHICDASP